MTNSKPRGVWYKPRRGFSSSSNQNTSPFSIDKNYEEFKALVGVIETYGGTFVEPSFINNELTLTSVVMHQGTNGEDMTIV